MPSRVPRKALESWLERAGDLEVVTEACERRKHVVMWKNLNGSYDVVA